MFFTPSEMVIGPGMVNFTFVVIILRVSYTSWSQPKNIFTSWIDKIKRLCHKNTQPKRSNSLHSKIARIAHFCPLLPTKPTIMFIFAQRTRIVQMLTFVPLGTRSLALANSFQQLSSNPPSTFVWKISSANEQHSYPDCHIWFLWRSY